MCYSGCAFEEYDGSCCYTGKRLPRGELLPCEAIAEKERIEAEERRRREAEEDAEEEEA